MVCGRAFRHLRPLGLYALHGGNENDYERDILPQPEYEALRHTFNPRRFDADAWVRSFKEAGARYAVLTTKHGEGFCLWDSDQTACTIAHTPFGRDLVAEYTPRGHSADLHGVVLAPEDSKSDNEQVRRKPQCRLAWITIRSTGLATAGRSTWI